MNLSPRPDQSRRTHWRPRLLLRLTGIVAVACLVAVGPLTAAKAHSELVSSTPAAGATAWGVPRQVTLVFNQEISPRFATVTLAVGGGAPRRMTLAVKGSRIAATPATASARLADTSGTPVTVTYRVVSADGHPITGAVKFTVVTPLTPSPSPLSSSASAVPGEVAVGAPRAADGEDADGVSMMATALVVGPLVLGLVIGIIALIRRRGDQQ